MPTRRRILMTAAALPFAGRALADDAVRVRDLYAPGGALSEFARLNAGRRVRLSGFMAPPLKAGARFFVLTNRPMAVCPFCESTADWPSDILAVYTKRVVEPVYYTVGIEASGVLETGAFTDPDTGFVSLLRLRDASYG